MKTRRLTATIIGLSQCLTLAFLIAQAQEIGHLGVDDDPVPLAQARRPPRRAAPRPQRQSKFEAFVAQGEEAARQGNARNAAEAYRQALVVLPEAPEARLGLADALFDLKQFGAAVGEYEKVVAPNPADAHRGRADAFYELHKWADAIREYEAALSAGANDAGTYNNLANALYRSGTTANRERAIGYYRQAIERQSDYADAYAGLANALRTQRGADGRTRLDESLAAASRAAELAPNSPLAHTILSRVYADRQDFTRAVAESERALQLAPQDPFVHVNLGGVHFAQGKYKEAEAAYLKAIALDPRWAFPYNSLGTLYLTRLNRLPDASLQFSKALMLEPNSPTLRANFGAARAAAGDYNEAVNQLKMSLEYDSRNASTHVKLGRVYIEQRKYNEALASFIKATELDSKNADYQLAVGDTYNLLGKKREAQEAFRRAEALGARNADPNSKEAKKDKKREKEKKKGY